MSVVRLRLARDDAKPEEKANMSAADISDALEALPATLIAPSGETAAAAEIVTKFLVASMVPDPETAAALGGRVTVRDASPASLRMSLTELGFTPARESKSPGAMSSRRSSSGSPWPNASAEPRPVFGPAAYGYPGLPRATEIPPLVRIISACGRSTPSRVYPYM